MGRTQCKTGLICKARQVSLMHLSFEGCWACHQYRVGVYGHGKRVLHGIVPLQVGVDHEWRLRGGERGLGEDRGRNAVVLCSLQLREVERVRGRKLRRRGVGGVTLLCWTRGRRRRLRLRGHRRVGQQQIFHHSFVLLHLIAKENVTIPVRQVGLPRMVAHWAPAEAG